MVSAPKTFALWMRLTAVVAAVLFDRVGGHDPWGAPLLPTSSPLPVAGYPFLVLTFIGWIWTLLKKRADAKSEMLSVLAASSIYKLAAPSTPEPVRDAIVARVENGEVPSRREIAAAIVEGKKRASDDRAAKAKL